jgi:hypothetical protein
MVSTAGEVWIRHRFGRGGGFVEDSGRLDRDWRRWVEIGGGGPEPWITQDSPRQWREVNSKSKLEPDSLLFEPDCAHELVASSWLGSCPSLVPTYLVVCLLFSGEQVCRGV